MKRLGRKLAHNVLVVTILLGGLWISKTAAPVEQETDPPGIIECWNRWTAQISTIRADHCPTPHRMR